MHTPYYQEIEFDSNRLYNLRKFERVRENDWLIGNHFHSLCEMVVYEEIEGVVRLDGQELAIQRGQVLFMPPETIHSFQVYPGRQIYHVMHFQPVCVSRLGIHRQMPETALLADIPAGDFDFLLSLIHWHEKELDSSNPEGLKDNAFNLLLGAVFEKALCVNGKRTTKRNNAFGPLIHFLNKNHRFSISINDAASLCHLSRSHFMMKFKQTYGVTFNRFMLDRKIEMAKYLLRSTDNNVTQIAHMLEMNSTSYFTKTFKAEVGCSPKVFQQRGKGIQKIQHSE